ncbi:MAG: ATP synthase F1 subunit delta [Myxococcales bacterium]|nr:MAG: ATP synthase F1 subunit delta [Myxococcales bacterium]
MKRSLVAKRYARALVDIAGSLTDAERLAEQLDLFARAAAASPDLAQVLANPTFAGERGKVVQAAAQILLLDALAQRSLAHLVARDRIRYVDQIVAEMHKLVEGKTGRVRAAVASAIELPEDHYKRIRAALERITGHKVTVEKEIRPDLIGGVVTRIGSVILDGSLRSQLSRLKASLGKEM